MAHSDVVKPTTGTEALPTVPVVWSRLIRELLQRSASYTDLNTDDVAWGTDAITAILPSLKAETLYKDLVYMNTGSKIGKFALIFGDKVAVAIKKRSTTDLETVLLAGTSPEFDDNKWLPGDEYNRYMDQLSREMVTLNALVDRVTRLTVLPPVLLDSPEYTKCREDVCVWQLPPDGVVSGAARDRVLLLDKEPDPMVWVADQAGTQEAYHAWCFKLPDLIKILMLDLDNPYTGVPFSARIVAALKQRYHVECLLVRRYLEVMGAIDTPVSQEPSPLLATGSPLPLPPSPLPIPRPATPRPGTASSRLPP